MVKRLSSMSSLRSNAHRGRSRRGSRRSPAGAGQVEAGSDALIRTSASTHGRRAAAKPGPTEQAQLVATVNMRSARQLVQTGGCRAGALRWPPEERSAIRHWAISTSWSPPRWPSPMTSTPPPGGSTPSDRRWRSTSAVWARRAVNFYHDLACRFGFQAEADVIQSRYLAGKKDDAAASVPDELIRSTSLIGPAGFVRERLHRSSAMVVLDVGRPAPPEHDELLIELLSDDEDCGLLTPNASRRSR